MTSRGLRICLPEHSLRMPEASARPPALRRLHLAPGEGVVSVTSQLGPEPRCPEHGDCLTPRGRLSWAGRNFLETSTWRGSSCLEEGCEQFMKGRLLWHEGGNAASGQNISHAVILAALMHMGLLA